MRTGLRFESWSSHRIKPIDRTVTTTQARRQIAAHIEPVRQRLQTLLAELEVPLAMMERHEVDPTTDIRYRAIAGLYFDIDKALERFNEKLTDINPPLSTAEAQNDKKL